MPTSLAQACYTRAGVREGSWPLMMNYPSAQDQEAGRQVIYTHCPLFTEYPHGDQCASRPAVTQAQEGRTGLGETAK